MSKTQKPRKKLNLRKASLRKLSHSQLEQANGGACAACSAGTCGSYYDCDGDLNGYGGGGGWDDWW